MGNETFGQEKKVCFLKNKIFVFLHTFFIFSFIFISPENKHTFISVNHIICNIGCLKQTGKRVLQLS